MCEALGLALAGGHATVGDAVGLPYGFTCAADRDFHAAATGAWWGDHADLAWRERPRGVRAARPCHQRGL